MFWSFEPLAGEQNGACKCRPRRGPNSGMITSHIGGNRDLGSFRTRVSSNAKVTGDFEQHETLSKRALW